MLRLIEIVRLIEFYNLDLMFDTRSWLETTISSISDATFIPNEYKKFCNGKRVVNLNNRIPQIDAKTIVVEGDIIWKHAVLVRGSASAQLQLPSPTNPGQSGTFLTPLSVGSALSPSITPVTPISQILSRDVCRETDTYKKSVIQYIK